MAIKKTIELDVNTKAGLKAMDELGLSFEEAFTEADNLSGQIGELECSLCNGCCWATKYTGV